MMHAMMTVMPNIAMRFVVNFANMGIPMVVTMMVMNVSAMVVVMAHMTCRRAPVMMRVLLLNRLLVSNPSCRSRRRFACARRHAEQYSPENQSRHNIYPPFHMEHRLSFSGFIVGRFD